MPRASVRVEHGPAAGPRRGQAALAAALLAALAGAAVAVAGDEDTASWERGKQLYTRGESASRRIVTADVQRGAPPVPASILPCVHCHGPDGRGKGDQAVAAPDIRWRALAGTDGQGDPVRQRRPFDEASFARAIARGIDPDGNELDAAMPRYTMAPEDVADLIAYLKRIGAELDPGLTPEGIRVGTIVPLAGPLAGTGRAIRDVVGAYFDRLNAAGGIHGRRLELVVAGFGESDDPAIWPAQDLVNDAPLFALVAPYVPGYEAALADLATAREVPLVGLYTRQPPAQAAAPGYDFYVLPGLPRQAEALVEAALARPDPPTRLAFVYQRAEALDDTADRLDRRLREAGLPPLETQAYLPDAFEAAPLAVRLRDRGVDALVFVGGAPELQALAGAGADARWRPELLAPAVLAEQAVFSLPPGFSDRALLAYPTLPTDRTPAGMAEFEALHREAGLDYRHSVAQVAAYTAARVLVEGLERAGRDPDRQGLIDSLESLSGFRPGLSPAVSYGPARRDGAGGAHVVEVDLPSGTLDAAAGVWIELDPGAQSAGRAASPSG